VRRFSAPWSGEKLDGFAVAMTQAEENRESTGCATPIGSAHNFLIRHCALRYDTPTNQVLTSSSLSESCP
jgi:hypothetical protein